MFFADLFGFLKISGFCRYIFWCVIQKNNKIASHPEKKHQISDEWALTVGKVTTPIITLKIMIKRNYKKVVKSLLSNGSNHQFCAMKCWRFISLYNFNIFASTPLENNWNTFFFLQKYGRGGTNWLSQGEYSDMEGNICNIN